MASIAWSDVVAIAPELADAPIGRQTLVLAIVNDPRAFAIARWGGEDSTNLKLGRQLRAAHLATLFGGGAASGMGQVIEITEGDVITKFAEAPKTGSSYASTGYGQEYMRLARIAGMVA